MSRRFTIQVHDTPPLRPALAFREGQISNVSMRVVVNVTHKIWTSRIGDSGVLDVRRDGSVSCFHLIQGYVGTTPMRGVGDEKG
jgi:hypothetical protein